jgi:hypothetical protein
MPVYLIFTNSAICLRLKTFDMVYVRDDEWVITGQSFTDQMWMNSEGKIQIGRYLKNQLINYGE